MAQAVNNGPPAFLQALNDALKRFGAITIGDLNERYVKWPDEANCKLGSGSYGEAIRVRAVDADHTREPERVAKIIPKMRISKNATQVQHLAAELAVSGILDHPNLNHRVGLFHNENYVFVILELCGGPRPDLVTRLAHLFAYRRPSRLPDIDRIIATWSEAASAAGVNAADEKALGDYVDREGLMKVMAAEVGVNLTRDNAELPVGTDLFGLIVAYRRISDPMAAIVLRQVLLGIEHLHQNQICHRDVKTENCVISINRRAVLKRDENNNIVGVSFFEKVDTKVIDFGLVKYMNLDAVQSPGDYIRATDAQRKQLAEEEKKKQQQQAAEKVKEDSAEKSKKQKDDDDEDDEDEEENNNGAQVWLTAGKNMAAIQKPPEAGSVNAFDPLAVTPCGTEIYCSLEALNGILNAGLGQARANWVSSKQTLPKMDMFGVGACLYCMSNGKPPFRPPDTYRRISREERMRQIERLVAAGPIFVSAASQQSRSLTLKLMDNDVHKRLTATQALQDPFVNHNTNVVVTDATLEGIVAIRLGHPNEFPSQHNQNQQQQNIDGAVSGVNTNKASTSAISATQVQSEAGSKAGTSDHSQPTAVPNNSIAGAPVVSGEKVDEDSSKQQQQQQQNREGSIANAIADEENNKNNNNNDDGETDEDDAAALNDVMEALRDREDDGDATGKPQKDDAAAH